MASLRHEGRLFKLRLERSHAARQAALATIQQNAVGWWEVQVGGAVRGRLVARPTRRACEAVVKQHYDAALFLFVKQRWAS